MKKFILPAVLAMASFITSCTKDEPLNTECDIRKAVVHLPRPQDYFVNLADTQAVVHQSFSSNEIVFKGVTFEANLDSITPTFTISSGAVMFPIQGTLRNFSENKKQPYYIIAEDTKANYPFPDTNDSSTVAAFEHSLDQAIARGEHIRRYEVQFKLPYVINTDVAYNFENYYLEPSGRFYEWSDLTEDNDELKVWATANEGYSWAAGSSTKANDYPSVPVNEGGVDKGAYVKLTTYSTGEWGKSANKPLAAGNLFLGSFDTSTALTRTLESTRFGDHIILGKKPARFSGHYKYTPGAKFTDVNGNIVAKEDRPAIYCVVYLNKDAEGKSYVLNGQTIDDPNNPYIIGRAELKQWTIYPSLDDQKNWVDFNIGFDWFKPLDEEILRKNGYNVAIVCTSSSEGATYSGAIGSTLLVDNLIIEMEK